MAAEVVRPSGFSETRFQLSSPARNKGHRSAGESADLSRGVEFRAIVSNFLWFVVAYTWRSGLEGPAKRHLHANARTTPKVRAELQASEADRVSFVADYNPTRRRFLDYDAPLQILNNQAKDNTGGGRARPDYRLLSP